MATSVLAGLSREARQLEILAAIEALSAQIAASTYDEDTPHVSGAKGNLLLCLRQDNDTATANDGDYTVPTSDEVGRLKVATQPSTVAAVSSSITAIGQSVAIPTNRISNLSISMVATTLVGHNAIFEFSNDSTDGSNGNWKTVQAVRTDSNIIETSTGVLATTPAYGWELNVASYQWFRVRATAHTSGTAAYVLKPGAYATEPVPSSQNAPLVETVFTQTGVIAVNTVLMQIDCQAFRSLLIHYTSAGTSGVITPEWSADGVNWATATIVTPSGASITTFSTVGVWKSDVFARYFRLRLSTATTAGTTTLRAHGSQQTTSVGVQVVAGTVGLGSGTNRFGFAAAPGIWYDDSSTNLAAAATFTGTSRDITAAATATAMASSASYAKEVRVSAESDQSGTLWIEVSRDGTNWRRAKSVPTAAVTGGGQFAEIIHRPSWRYLRVGFTNGASAQTRFAIGSFLMAN